MELVSLLWKKIPLETGKKNVQNYWKRKTDRETDCKGVGRQKDREKRRLTVCMYVLLSNYVRCIHF
jgi:hypothetical protein